MKHKKLCHKVKNIINELEEKVIKDINQSNGILFIRHLRSPNYNYYNDNANDVLTPSRGVVIVKGNKRYAYGDFYYAMLWLYYYHSTNRKIENKSWSRTYFSRIPTFYRAIDPVEGIKIVKEALYEFLMYYHGIPKYFNEEDMNKICYVSL